LMEKDKVGRKVFEKNHHPFDSIREMIEILLEDQGIDEKALEKT
jgi:hypothetical protein